eukprot:6441003-Amphidinium_carterae.1
MQEEEQESHSHHRPRPMAIGASASQELTRLPYLAIRVCCRLGGSLQPWLRGRLQSLLLLFFSVEGGLVFLPTSADCSL